MALSGKITGTVSNRDTYYSFYIEWSATQDISANKSSITVKTYWSTNDSSRNFDTSTSRTAWIQVGDEKKSISKQFDVAPWPSGNKYLIQEETFDVSHAEDGTKAVKISAYADGTAGSYGPSASNASKTVTLNTIPRASSFGTISGNTLGSSITVNVSRNNSTFKHLLQYKLGNSSWAAVSPNFATSCTFTPELSLCSQLPKATSGTLKLKLSTLDSEGYLVGSEVTKDITVYVPASVVPTIGGISWTKSNSSPEPSTWPMTQYVSKGTLSMTSVSGSYDSTITSYKLTFDSLSSASSSLTVDRISSSGTLQAVATVTDSRGRTAEKKVNFSVTAYSPPDVTATVYRSNGSGTEDSSGDYIYVKATATVSPVGNNSLQSLTFKYKQSTSSTYTSTSLTSGTAKIISASSDYTWNWVVTASDRVHTTEIKDDAGTGEVVMDIAANGLGMGLGKVSEAGGLEVDWVSTFSEKATFNNGLEITKARGDTFTISSNASHTSNSVATCPTIAFKMLNQTTNEQVIVGRLGCKSNGDLIVGASYVLLHEGNIGAYFAAAIADGMRDTVLEQGTSGIWTYRKWSSGIAECWGEGAFTITGWNTWGVLYESANTYQATYPTDLFIATPLVNISVSRTDVNNNIGTCGLEVFSGASKTQTPVCYALRPGTGATGTIYLSIFARGRWRQEDYVL